MSTSPNESTPDRRRSASNSVLGDVWVNVERWNRKALRNPTAFLLEIVVGLLSLLLFTAVFGDVGALAMERAGYGGVDYVTFLLPAVLMQVTMGSSFTAGIGLVDDLESGMFEKTVVTPMSWTAVFTGKAVSELLRIVVQLGLVLGLGVVLGANIETGLAGAVGVVLVCLLVGLLFMAIANIVAMVARDEEVVNAASMLFMFPLLFLSPAFIPMSGDVELLATFNPITYGVDAVRAIVLGEDVLTVLSVGGFGGVWNTIVPALGVLAGLNVVFGAVAVALMARASSSSVA